MDNKVFVSLKNGELAIFKRNFCNYYNKIHLFYRINYYFAVVKLYGIMIVMQLKQYHRTLLIA